MSGADLRIRRVVLEGDDLADPLDALALAPGEPAFYWRSDERDIEIAALGAVAVVDAQGPQRFAEASAALRRLSERVVDASAGDSARQGADSAAMEGASAPMNAGNLDPSLPFAVGGFAFDDAAPAPPWEGFPALRFFVPRALWIREHGRRRLVLAHAGPRGQTPAALLQRADCETPRREPENAAPWRARVQAAVETIRGGELEKIVLARRCRVNATQPFAVEAMMRALAEARPSCFTFLVRWNGRTFLGSSPERLVRVQDGRADADALAGSAARGHSRTHDEMLARELIESAKERREHRIVADAVRDALAPLALDVDAAADPVVMRLPEAHHLHTPVRARLARPNETGLLDVAGHLHPTPAVCGMPRAEACRRLAIEEPDRGWYGGAIGWIDARGDGELAVALRAALLDGDAREGAVAADAAQAAGNSNAATHAPTRGATAHVWAGAGIVDGSSPEREFEETERKMRSILPFLEAPRDVCAA